MKHDPVVTQMWRNRMSDQSASGLSGLQWCKREGVSSDQFYQWRRKLGVKDTDSAVRDWLAVRVVDPTSAVQSASGRLILRVGAAVIDIEPGFDPVLLRSVVLALEPQPC